MPQPLKPAPANVQNILDAYPAAVRECLIEVRGLIYDVAAEHPEIGELDETLKWGQPSYLPLQPRVGSTVRIDKTKDSENSISVFFICTSGLMDQFRDLYPELIPVGEKRALRFECDKPLPEEELKHCFALALTSHLRKRAG